MLFALAGMVPAFASADQTHPQLEELFQSLQQAESDTQTRKIQSQIWQLWLEAPDQNASYLSSQIATAMSVGQNEMALRLSNQLIDSTPKFAEAWNKRATIQYLLGNHALSIADIKQTLLLEPRHFGALSGLGHIFTDSGNYAAALDVFNQVLQLSPNSQHAQANVSRVEALIGDDI